MIPRCVRCQAQVNAHFVVCADCEHGRPDPDRTHAAFRARAAAARAAAVAAYSGQRVDLELVSGRAAVQEEPDQPRRRRGGRRR